MLTAAPPVSCRRKTFHALNFAKFADNFDWRRIDTVGPLPGNEPLSEASSKGFPAILLTHNERHQVRTQSLEDRGNTRPSRAQALWHRTLCLSAARLVVHPAPAN